MCANLVSKGNLDKPLILYNRTKQRSEDLSKKLGTSKTKVASTITDAVKDTDIILICVGDDAAVNSTVDTILESDVQGKTIVDCSTVHPDTTNALEQRITAAGAAFVGMPVFGAPAMADAGSLVCVAAGKADAVKTILPYTDGVMGRATIDFSDQPAGNATLLKVIGNTFILNMVNQLSEGHVLAEKSGLGVDNLHTFISTMFPGVLCFPGDAAQVIDEIQGHIQRTPSVCSRVTTISVMNHYFTSILHARTQGMQRRLQMLVVAV